MTFQPDDSGELSFPLPDGYEVVEVLGRSRYATVYRAMELALERRVVVKVYRPTILPKQVPSAGDIDDSVAEGHFVEPEAQSQEAQSQEAQSQEAQCLARIKHPHCVSIYGSGVADGCRYLILEDIEGRGLETLDRDEVTVREALRWARQIAQVLESLHQTSICHLDVKPSNIMVRTNGDACLIDFGTAYDHSGAGTPDPTGGRGGTLRYTAPERIEDHQRSLELESRCDQFSWAATFYEILSGDPVFSAQDEKAIIHQVLHQDPLPLRKPGRRVPRDFETILLKGLEKDPDARYESMAALGQDLDRFEALRPILARRPSLALRCHRFMRRHRGALVASLLSLVALGVLAWALTREDRQRSRTLAQTERVLDQALSSGDWSRATVHLNLLRSLNADKTLIEDRSQRLDALRDADRAESLVQHGRELFTMYRQLCEDIDHWRGEVDALEFLMIQRMLEPEESLRLNLARNTWRKKSQEKPSARAELTNLLEDIGSLEGKSEAGQTLAFDFYALEFSQTEDLGRRRVFRERLLELDSRAMERLRGRVRLTLQGLPEHSSVDVFEYRRQSDLLGPEGDDRFVLTPLVNPEGTDEWTGKWALEVREATGELEPGDLIYEVEGFAVEHLILLGEDLPQHGIKRGARLLRCDHRRPFMRDAMGEGQGLRAYEWEAPAKDVVSFTSSESLEIHDVQDFLELYAARCGVLRDLRWLECQSLPGVEVRVSANPVKLPRPREGALLRGSFSIDLLRGDYLLLVRAPGFQDLRVPWKASDSPQQTLEVEMISLEHQLEGFRFVSGGAVCLGGDARDFDAFPIQEEQADSFWIQETETTVSDYLQFLNAESWRTDPRRDELFPRLQSDPESGILIGKGQDGEAISLFDGRTPIVGIDHVSATLYAQWRTANSQDYQYQLPSRVEWVRAARGPFVWRLPFGNTLHPIWVGHRESMDSMTLRLGGEFPIDESPFGVLDMAGNASEWLREKVADGAFGVKGGDYGRIQSRFFHVGSNVRYVEGFRASHLGIRLVARTKKGD